MCFSTGFCRTLFSHKPQIEICTTVSQRCFCSMHYLQVSIARNVGFILVIEDLKYFYMYIFPCLNRERRATLGDEADPKLVIFCNQVCFLSVSCFNALSLSLSIYIYEVGYYAYISISPHMLITHFCVSNVKMVDPNRSSCSPY